MFRKLVSNLPFSPALVGQLGFYARRLSKEQFTRRLGLIFTVLALIVQSFAILKPPEPTIAASQADRCIFDMNLLQTDENCQSCPYDSTIWAKDDNCLPTISLSNDATNLTRNKPAQETTANPADRIQYNLHTTSVGDATTTAELQVNVRDLLEYATIIDLGGGTLDTATGILDWGTVELEIGQTDTRNFVAQVNETVVATPQSSDNPLAYDCLLTVTYGNTTNAALNCPFGKDVERAVRWLPTAGLGMNVVFSSVIVLAAAYFYMRSRQLTRELRLIRREFNAGPF